MSFPVSPTNGQFALVNNIGYTYSSANNAWSRSKTISASMDTLYVTGAITANNLVTSNSITFTAYTEGVVAYGNSSSSKTLSIANGTIQTITVNANCTITMPTVVAGKSFTLFANTGAGSNSITFSGSPSIRWLANTAPISTTVANRIDIYSFVSDGTFWYGNSGLNF